MGFFGSIGNAFKSIGKTVGNAVYRPLRGVSRIARGDFKAGFSDIGHGIKRAAQAGAILGTGGAAAAPLLIGGAAAGGMLEKGFSGDSGGVSGVLGSGLHGATSTAALGKAGNIARGFIKGGGAAAGGVEAASGASGMHPATASAREIGSRIPGATVANAAPSAVSDIGANVRAVSSGGVDAASTYGNAVDSYGAIEEAAGSRLGNIGRGVRDAAGSIGDYAKDNPEMLLKGAGQWIEGNQRQSVDNRVLDIREQQNEYEQSDEYWRRQMLLRGPNSRWY